MRWLNDDEIIEFTNPRFKSQNVEFEINNSGDRKMWLTQFINIFLDEELNLISSTITFKGEKPTLMRKYNANDLWKLLQNKKFKVKCNEKSEFAFNRNSQKGVAMGFRTFVEARDYIRECITSGRISDIGDLLKDGICYDLTEV